MIYPVARVTYSTTGLTTVTGPFSHALTFTFDSSGRVSTMTLPDGTNKYTYIYDTNNNLIQVTNPDATSHAFGHGTIFPSLITSLVDEDGNPYGNWSYDSTGHAINSQSAAGVNSMSLTYTSTSAVSATDALGNTHTYSLTTNSGLVQPSSVGGVPDLSAGGASFTYDANGFLASRTDYDGNITTYTHNAKGEETSRTEASSTGLARTTTTTWNATFHLPNEIDQPLSRTTTFGYDANGNLLKESVTDGTHTRIWSYTYNANGQRISATDPLSNTTTWTYDASGDVATMVNALNQTTTYSSYDGNARLLVMKDPLGLTTTFAYDKLGHMISKKVGGLLTSYAWDIGVNKISKITYPDSSALTYGFDDAHRLIQIKDTGGDAIKYTYDNASNLTVLGVYDPTPTLKLTHSYTYDASNRVLTSIGAAVGETTTYGYDNQSNLTHVTDPLSHTTTYSYDALNRLSTVIDALSHTTTYGYDALDDLTGVKDGRGLTTSYGYDGLGDTTSVVSPDTGTTVMTYDTYGHVLTSTDALSQTTTYKYDALNRTTTELFSGGSIVYTYDTGTNGTGHLTQVVDPAGTTNWSYDQFGRVLSKAQTTDALTLTTTYSYDASGRLSTMKFPSTKQITYTYDSSGRIATMQSTVNVSGITYFPFGPTKGWSQPNGSTFVRTFDQDGRITGLALNSTTTNVETITYDNASNVTALSETATYFALSHTATYDSLNRVTGFFNGTTTTSWAYDNNSNRLSSTLSGTTTYTISGTSNQVTALTGTTTQSFTWNADGNQTADGTHSYGYDGRALLTTETTAGVVTSYGINWQGQRITKSGANVPNGGTNEYVYDEAGHLIGEYSSTGHIVNETVWLPNTPVSQYGMVDANGPIAFFGDRGVASPAEVLTTTGGATVSSVTPDWLNAPHIITNSTKGYQWIWDHYAFGDNAPNQNPAGLGAYTYNLRFPGQYADSESNLNYNWNRSYGPTLGQYIQADPIGLLGGQPSLYPYAFGNPVRNIDPFGLTADCPALPPNNDPIWKPYVGNSWWFHCNGNVFLENRNPTPQDPIGECVYDNCNKLIDENSRYPACKGTPDQYSASDWWNHFMYDSGGIVQQGGPAFIESRRHDIDQLKQSFPQFFAQ